MDSLDNFQGQFSSGSAPISSCDELRQAVRDMLRFGGFKPTGRSKPASEYLIKAVAENRLGPINLAVDVCNLVSFHSGLPITVVDRDLLVLPASVRVAPPGSRYMFNASGQEIDVGGLVCLHDAIGPCGNAVKDAQRTKTNAHTRVTWTLIWGTTEFPGQAEATERWYRALLESCGAETHSVFPASSFHNDRRSMTNDELESTE
jgi:DNA/RNA-binding domain of Phe-tRNA-synthetase-like protein